MRLALKVFGRGVGFAPNRSNRLTKLPLGLSLRRFGNSRNVEVPLYSTVELLNEFGSV
jgi:hypothetical protein